MKYYLFLLLVFSFQISFANKKLSIGSPNHGISLEIPSNFDDRSFDLFLNNERVSSLCFGVVLDGDSLSFHRSEAMQVRQVVDVSHYNEYVLECEESLKLRLRIYNDALAFRYEGDNDAEVRLDGELSSWQLPKESVVWYFERKNAWKLKSYAGLWEHCKLADLKRTAWSPIQGTPVIFSLPFGKYGFISEAALENYSGLRLMAENEETLKANFTEGKSGFSVPAHFHSPWRVLYIGESLNDLVNQKVIRHLSPAPDETLYKDKSYIVPGKCAWRWFSKGTGNPQEEREVIDAAAQLNFSYSLVDDGWNKWKNCWAEARDLVAYGKKKGVRLLFWQHSKPLQDKENDYQRMRVFLDSISAIGAAGVKVDFMDSEALPLIQFETRLLKECAKRKLVVNFHGCQKPAGESFTYPNELTREGIRGLELNKMREGYIPGYHNAALPFTRFVVGHGDYTPLTFTVPGSTTWAHQLATLVVFDSPLQTIAEDPDLLLKEPRLSGAIDFIKDVPTVWDETRVLVPSEIGKLAMLARRKGDDWYIGVLNGEKKEKNVEVDLLPFTKRRSKVRVYQDDLDAPKVLLPMEGHRPCVLKREASVPFKVDKVDCSRVNLRLAAEGGAVVVIKNK